jgi:hypothetical protein
MANAPQIRPYIIIPGLYCTLAGLDANLIKSMAIVNINQFA